MFLVFILSYNGASRIKNETIIDTFYNEYEPYGS